MLGAMVALVPSGLALAQGAPGSLQPGRIGKDVEPPKPPPEIRTPEVNLPVREGQEAPANAEEIRFVLTEVAVDGNSAIPTSRLAGIWEERLGKEISLADVYRYGRAVTDIYQREGFVLSLAIVPVQTIAAGKVRLAVVEGYIDSVSVQDTTGKTLPEDATRLAAKLTGEHPLKLATLERALLLLNDEAGTSARAYLQRSAQAGATHLAVIVSRTPYSASISADNHGTKLLGPERYGLAIGENGQLGLRERNRLSLQGTYDGRLKVWSYSGDIPFGTDGLEAALSYTGSRAQPNLDRDSPDLVLKSSSVTLGLRYPIRRSRTGDLVARVNISFENARSDAFGTLLNEDKVRPMRLGVSWSGLDAWGGINLTDVELSQGIRGMGASRANSPLLTREKSKIDFTKLNLYLARLQPLSDGWSLLGAITGQFSHDRLVPLEQLGLGGEQVLRGFGAAEILGDKGFGAKLEVRRVILLGFGSATAYAFYDHGQVWNNNLRGGSTRSLASSTGIGIRSSPALGVSGYLEIAKPLGRDVAILADRQPRVFAGLMLAY